MSALSDRPTRRAVLVASAAATAVAVAPRSTVTTPELRVLDAAQAIDLASDPKADRWQPHKLNLAPARWIWLPCGRVLPNTFVLFRREIDLSAKPVRATALVTGDSRYRLTVNGQRAGWGPAPSDPRELDVDPIDLTPLLQQGANVLGAEVLFYGTGEGTWPGGKPGFLFQLVIDMPDGERRVVSSDDQWLTYLDRAHTPGKPKRWFLRALQEEFDARRHPEGWDQAGFRPDALWLPAWVSDTPADKPAAAGSQPFWSGDTVDRVNPARSSLRLRQIPPCREVIVPVAKLAESGRVEWLRPPEDWFESRIPGSFRITREDVAKPLGEAAWELRAPATNEGIWATFELAEQVVGWPRFTIDAPAGTVIEAMVQESHDPAKTAWLDSQFFAWARFICKEGVNEFECFDFESLRWLQLHVRNASRPVKISAAGVRRRLYDWPVKPHVVCSDPPLQRLFDASVNTLYNCAIETVVDGMARERQQYSGDGGHQFHAIRYAFGETRIGRRYLRTFSEGLSTDGYFLDCWPAHDRLARISQKQVDGAYWGPLLDHGVGFNFDCWNHYWETGERDALVEPFPRLVRFAGYLTSIRKADGLLPVEDLGIPTVWMDHIAYKQQRHKACSFNLYAAAMLSHALAPIADILGEPARANEFRQLSASILAAVVRRFWDPRRKLFVANLPWVKEEKETRLCDRSLATSILHDQCPGGAVQAALQALAECPAEMGLSYPCNAGWRYWALSRLGRADVVLRDLRQRWAVMPSVILNNTLQEDWTVRSDSTSQWSHCPLAPLFEVFMDIAGIRATAPGFSGCQIRPQLGDLDQLSLTAHTVRGPIQFDARSERGGHEIQLSLPAGCSGEVLVPADSSVPLRELAPSQTLGLKRYRLEAGQTATLWTSTRK
jgi:alpha-L-rhamnosidase